MYAVMIRVIGVGVMRWWIWEYGNLCGDYIL